MLKQETWWEENRPTGGPLYADGVSYQAYYSEVGKAHYMGKDLTEVRCSQRKLLPDKVGLEQYEPTSLRGIAIKARADGKHRFQNLYRCLDASLLYASWQDLNKDAASGVDEMTAQAYEENLEGNIEALAERLKSKDPGPIYLWVSRYHGEAPSHQMMITFVEWGNRHVQDMNSLLRRWPKATRCETFDRLKWAATDSGQVIRFNILDAAQQGGCT